MNIKFYPEEQFKHNTLYYDYQPLDGFACHVKIIVGARGIGKTFGSKKKVLKDNYYNKNNFIWLRDTESACDIMREGNGHSFFADVNEHLFKKDYEGGIIGEQIVVNDKIVGRLMPSSTFYKYKGNSFSLADFKTIVYDEFIAENDQITRGNRARMFFNTLETLGRLRDDYEVILLANALNRGDEIINAMGFKVKQYGYYVNREKSCVLHYASNSPVYEEAKKTSLIGKLLKGTQFESNMVYNSFDDDEKMFFDKKPSSCKLLAILSDGYESVRIYYGEDYLYVENDGNYNAYSNMRYVVDYKQVSSVLRLIQPELLKVIKNFHAKSLIKYGNSYIYNLFIKIISKGK